MGNWVHLFYRGGYRSSICHPGYAARRRRYMEDRHGVSPDKIRPVESNHIDGGGWIQVANDTHRDVDLGDGRKVSFWDKHSGWLLRQLEMATWQDGYYRVPSWPSLLTFLSSDDRKKVMDVLLR